MVWRLPAASAGTVNRLVLLAARFTRPMTLGVRAVVLDDRNRVFLVRHSYIPGWHFPGGAVEAGETVLEAAAREALEEGNIAIKGVPALHGIFFNAYPSRRDHVVVFVVRDFDRLGPRPADWEIVDSGFFPLGDLPEGTSQATRARLEELVSGRPVAGLW